MHNPDAFPVFIQYIGGCNADALFLLPITIQKNIYNALSCHGYPKKLKYTMIVCFMYSSIIINLLLHMYVCRMEWNNGIMFF